MTEEYLSRLELWQANAIAQPTLEQTKKAELEGGYLLGDPDFIFWDQKHDWQHLNQIVDWLGETALDESNMPNAQLAAMGLYSAAQISGGVHSEYVGNALSGLHDKLHNFLLQAAPLVILYSMDECRDKGKLCNEDEIVKLGRSYHNLVYKQSDYKVPEKYQERIAIDYLGHSTYPCPEHEIKKERMHILYSNSQKELCFETYATEILYAGQPHEMLNTHVRSYKWPYCSHYGLPYQM